MPSKRGRQERSDGTPPQPQPDVKLNPRNEFNRLGSILRAELIRYSPDNKLLHLASPWLIAAVSLAYFGGPQEEINAQRSIDLYALETMSHFFLDRPDRQTFYRAGIITPLEDTQAENLLRMGMNSQLSRKAEEYDTRLFGGLKTLADSINGPIAKAFAAVPQSEQARIAEMTGRLVAYRILLGREFAQRNPNFVQIAEDLHANMWSRKEANPQVRAESLSAWIRLLDEPLIKPIRIQADNMLYHLRRSNPSDKPIVIAIPTATKTVLLGEPELSTASVVSEYSQFSNIVFANRSPFNAALFGELARGYGKRLGTDLEQADTASTRDGISEAIRQYGQGIDVVQLFMTGLFPRNASEIMHELGEQLKVGATVIVIAPEKSHHGEASARFFDEQAREAGLVSVPFLADRRPLFEFRFSTDTSEETDLIIMVFKKERDTSTWYTGTRRQ